MGLTLPLQCQRSNACPIWVEAWRQSVRGLALLLLPHRLGLGVEGEETAEAQAPRKGHVMRMGHTILCFLC